jgi:branched-chain amino acid transport system ATP-binding protein
LGTELLQLIGVHTHYGESHVLQGISFELREGDLLALLGRNGAGKTTLMLTLSGLLEASNGSIVFKGEDLTKSAAEHIAKKGIRLVPQGRRVFTSLSVHENLLVAAQHQHQKNAWNHERVYHLFPELRQHQAQRAGTLSGGEQQMLVIARALMGNPKLLLLDEPTEGLAPLIVQTVVNAIAKLKAEGLTMIMVEQNFTVAQLLADQFVVLNTGQLAYQGSAQDIKLKPELVTSHLSVF